MFSKYTTEIRKGGNQKKEYSMPENRPRYHTYMYVNKSHRGYRYVCKHVPTQMRTKEQKCKKKQYLLRAPTKIKKKQIRTEEEEDEEETNASTSENTATTTHIHTFMYICNKNHVERRCLSSIMQQYLASSEKREICI